MASIIQLSDYQPPSGHEPKASVLCHDALALRDAFDAMFKLHRAIAETALGSLLYWGRISKEEFDVIRQEVMGD